MPFSLGPTRSNHSFVPLYSDSKDEPERTRRSSFRDRLLRPHRHSQTGSASGDHLHYSSPTFVRSTEHLQDIPQAELLRLSSDDVGAHRAEALAKLDGGSSMSSNALHQALPLESDEAIDRESLFAVKVLLQAKLGDRALRRHALNYIGTPQADTTVFLSHNSQEGHDLWLALHDGVILMRYINQLYPEIDLHPLDDSEHHHNAARIVEALRTDLGLPRKTLFETTDLTQPSVDGLNKVLRCILQIPILSHKAPPSNRHHKSLSSPPPVQASGSSSSLDPFGLRKGSNIVIRPRNEESSHSRRAQMFYGLDRRMSESALDLPSVEESEEVANAQVRPSLAQNKQRAKPSRALSMNATLADKPLFAKRAQSPRRHFSSSSNSISSTSVLPASPLSKSFEEQSALRPAKSDRRPSHLSRSVSSPDSSRPPSLHEEVPLPAVNLAKKRPLSATSSSSIPFPTSPYASGHSTSPNSSPHRPRHYRWNSEVTPNSTRSENSRRQSSGGLDLSGSSGESNAPFRRASFVPNRHRITVKEDGRPVKVYQLAECIGRGQFGSVYRAMDIASGRVFAVKRIRLAGKSEEEITQLTLEVDLLKSVSHPAIVSYVGLLQTENYLNIILEYVENGSLLDTLKTFGEFPENLVVSYVVQILEGLRYLHEQHIVHCDLKCANILTTKSGNIKIGDFGVSLNLNTIKNNGDVELLAGTPHWLSPEIIQLRGASTASDIWSLGCVIVEMLTGKPPYADLMSMAALYHIVEDDLPPIPPKASQQLHHFLVACFAKEPDERPTADALFRHSWLDAQLSATGREQRPQDSIPFIDRLSSSTRRPTLANSVLSDLPDLDYSPSSHMSSSLDTPLTPKASSIEQISMPLSNDLHHRGQGSGSQDSPTAFNIPGLPSSISRTDHVLFADQTQANHSQSTRSHIFVKTSFGKALGCRICQTDIKRHAKAFLCEGCGLICHASCISLTASFCDLRASLVYPTRPNDGVGRSLQSTSLVSVLPSPSASTFFSKVRPKLGAGPKAKSASFVSGIPLTDSGFHEGTHRSDSSGSVANGAQKSSRFVKAHGMRSLSTDALPLRMSANGNKLKRRESGSKDDQCTVS